MTSGLTKRPVGRLVRPAKKANPNLKRFPLKWLVLPAAANASRYLGFLVIK